MTDFNPRLLPFVYTESHADKLAKLAYESFPPSHPEEELPLFWMWGGSADEFNKKYGHLGPVVWCRRNAYHRLLINGQQVMRLWTTHTNPRAEMCESLANVVEAAGMKGIVRVKSSHYAAWVQIRNKEEVHLLMSTIKRLYNV